MAKAKTTRPRSPHTSKSNGVLPSVLTTSWRAAAARNAAGPKAPGSKEIPEGAPDCLGNLTFVFTGELDCLGRDEAIELVKRYSG
jgi:BRCT domain type II-containing protein